MITKSIIPLLFCVLIACVGKSLSQYEESDNYIKHNNNVKALCENFWRDSDDNENNSKVKRDEVHREYYHHHRHHRHHSHQHNAESKGNLDHDGTNGIIDNNHHFGIGLSKIQTQAGSFFFVI